MEYIIYLILSPIAFTVMFITMTVTWKYRHEKTGRSLLIYFAFVLLFLTTNVFELMALSERWMLTWTKFQISFYSLIPVAWVMFALRLTRSESDFVRKLKYLLLIIPFFTILLVSAYPRLSFFYTGHSVSLIGQYSTLDTRYGPFFWVFGAHAYLLLIVGAMIILKYIYSDSLYVRRQVFFVSLGTALPLMANILYILPLPFFTHKDYTPLAFSLAGLLFFISIYWHRFLEVIPYARNIIIDEMDQALLILDHEGSVIDANRSFLDLFALDKGIIGKNVNTLEPVWPYIDREYLSQKDLFEVVLAMGEKRITCSVRIKPILMEGNREYGRLITFSDISLLVGLYNEKLDLLKKMEETYQKLNSTKLQLIHKDKLAAIGHISAGMAHEIKNPLSFLTSNHRYLYKQLEKMKSDPGLDVYADILTEIWEVLDDSGEGMQRILDVVNNLLDFSRKEGEDTMDHEFDLNSGVERTLKILKGTINPSLSVEKDLGSLPGIECFSSEINQVMLNLLTNAVQAAEEELTPDSSVKVKTWAADQKVAFSITNTGAPIKEESLKKVFDPFFTTKIAGKGTGLGLSIASDIVVKRHNGTIDIDRRGEYTVFTVSLPVFQGACR